MTNTCVNPDCCAERHLHGSDNAEGHECAPREVRDQAYLCAPCRGRLGRMLAELPSLYEELTESLTTVIVRGGRRSKKKGTSVGLNVEPIVVAARDHIHAWLSDWVRIVAEERGLTLPTRDVPDTLAHWLGRHVDWLAHQPYADEVITNLHDTHREGLWARQIVPSRRFEIKLPDKTAVQCPEIAEGPALEHGQPPRCPGTVWATIRPDSTFVLPAEVGCSVDLAHVWTPSQWPALGRHVRPTLNEDAMSALTRALSA